MSHVLPSSTGVPLWITPCVGGRNVNLSTAGVQQVSAGRLSRLVLELRGCEVSVKYGTNITIPLASKGDWLIAQS